MRGCVPQRQIFPCRNWIISEDVGLGFECRSATLLMIIPGVQNAHWKASASRKACCTGCRRPSFCSPSMVVIDFPTPALTGTWHERRGAPPIRTVHAPHCPSPQPYLLPVKPSSSRKTSNRGVSGGYLTGYRLSLTSISIGFAMIPPRRKIFRPIRVYDKCGKRPSHAPIRAANLRHFFNPHRLDIHKLANSVNSEFPPMTRPLHSTEWETRIGSYHAIYENHSRFEIIHETFALSFVIRPGACSKPKTAVVGDANRVLQIFGAEHARHRAKQFFPVRR